MQRSLISLIVGVVLAIVAVGLLALYVRGIRGSATVSAAASDVGTVVVAANNLPFGAAIKRDYLKTVQWPQESIPAGAFHSIDEVFAGSDGSDRIVLRPIVSDEPVLKSTVSGFGAKATLSREVAPGMRAVSIRINDVSGVAGFLLPGDRVDVMLTRKLPGDNPNNDLVTDVILQDITVLGTDQLSDQNRDKPVVARTATLQVTTEQAQKLALAQEAGTLSLALRSVATVGHEQTSRVEAGDLAETTRLPPRRNSGPGVRVIYGIGH